MELILLALLEKAAAHCLRTAEMCLYRQKLTYFQFFPHLLLCLKYIILLLLLTSKSRGLSVSLWKLNIAFKSQFP